MRWFAEACQKVARCQLLGGLSKEVFLCLCSLAEACPSVRWSDVSYFACLRCVSMHVLISRSLSVSRKVARCQLLDGLLRKVACSLQGTHSNLLLVAGSVVNSAGFARELHVFHMVLLTGWSLSVSQKVARCQLPGLLFVAGSAVWILLAFNNKIIIKVFYKAQNLARRLF